MRGEGDEEAEKERRRRRRRIMTSRLDWNFTGNPPTELQVSPGRGEREESEGE